MNLENNNVLCRAVDSALLIVDIQTRLTATIPNRVMVRLRRNTTLLLQAASRLAVPVFASEHYPKGLGPLEDALKAQLPAGSPVYEKTAFSCAALPAFQQALSESGRRQVIIAGMEAHICVLQTAVGLQQQGYDVFVVADAVCSRRRESYETALLRLRGLGACVCDVESVVFEWLGDAAHVHFKPIAALLK